MTWFTCTSVLWHILYMHMSKEQQKSKAADNTTQTAMFNAAALAQQFLVLSHMQTDLSNVNFAYQWLTIVLLGILYYRDLSGSTTILQWVSPEHSVARVPGSTTWNTSRVKMNLLNPCNDVNDSMLHVMFTSWSYSRFFPRLQKKLWGKAISTRLLFWPPKSAGGQLSTFLIKMHRNLKTLPLHD